MEIKTFWFKTKTEMSTLYVKMIHRLSVTLILKLPKTSRL